MLHDLNQMYHHTVTPRCNTVVRRHLLGRFIGYGISPVDLFDNYSRLTNKKNYGLKLDMQAAPNAQNTDDNAWESKTHGRGEHESISNTVIGCLRFGAPTKRHRRPFARLLFGLRTLGPTRYRTWYSVSGCSVNLTCISDD